MPTGPLEKYLNPPEFVVTRAPFRISFAGGGTDLPSFYQREHGAVVSSAIDKYTYVIVNTGRPILQQGVDDPGRHRIRLSYSTTENVQSPDELSHPIVREALKFLELDIPMDISSMADVPAGNGLGSSGTFSVALLHALHLVRGDTPGPEQLADEAAHIEIDILGRPVGKQDHYSAAYGGLNTIRFKSNGEVDVCPVASADMAKRQLFPSLILLYTGQSRDAGQVLAEQKTNVECLMDELLSIRCHAHELDGMFRSGFDVDILGAVLHQTWMRKRKLASTISNVHIDQWYQRAIEAGALGGKICGAGGGGFLMLVVQPERRTTVRQALTELVELEIGYEPQGSRAIVCAGQAPPI